jgi:phosphoenolpyruvate carboxylase
MVTGTLVNSLDVTKQTEIRSLTISKIRLSSADKDEPLKEDIRLLGRLLGEVLRAQEGDAVYDVVETVRQTAVRFRREADSAAGAELNRMLKKLTREQTISVVRAFSYFSHLANIAEDQHHNRRRRAHLLAGSAAQPGSIPYALSNWTTPACPARRSGNSSTAPWCRRC